ncbi:MAG: hypothetical protein ACYTGX_14040 [Planctomycetota bacterium]|jgi:hypothetical protein
MHTPSMSHEHCARLLAEHYSWSVGGPPERGMTCRLLRRAR